MFRKTTLSLFICLIAVLGMSVAVVSPVAAPAEVYGVEAALVETGLANDAVKGMEEFLELTPKKYREMTGEKLSLKETIALKVAQKKLKKELRKGQQRDDIPVSKGLFIVLAILVPIAAIIMMGIADEWAGNRWWVALILYALCYIPGLIYTLTKLNDYTYSD